MYSLKKVYCRELRAGVRWVEQDLATILATDVRQVTALFGGTRMVLEHPASPGVQYLLNFTTDALPFINQFTVAQTVAQWFTALGDAALPTSVFTGIKTVTANFADALEAGFGVEMVVPGGVPDKSPWAARTDLLLTHPTLAPALVEQNTLISVNGFLHRSYASDRGLYVMQGGRSVQRADINTVGIVSMANLGGCKIIPIVPSMLSALPGPGEILETPLYLTVPDVDWDTHSAMLSLCGRLLPLGQTFRAVGNGVFEVNLLRYPYLENFLKAEAFMDLSVVRETVARKVDAPSMIAVGQAKGAAFLQALLTVSQSFIIVVNGADLYVDKIPLETTQHPCMFMHHETVTSPAISHDGRLLNYLLEKQGDDWLLHVSDGIHARMRMHDIPWHRVNAVDAVRPNLRRLEPGNCSILDIKRDIFY